MSERKEPEAHKEAMAALAKVKPKRVLDMLGALVKKLGPNTTRVGGVVQYIVTGDEGGVFWLDLNQPGGSLGEARMGTPLADVTVFTNDYGLRALLLGDEHLNYAIESRQIQFEGDVQKLIDLGRLLEKSGHRLLICR